MATIDTVNRMLENAPAEAHSKSPVDLLGWSVTGLGETDSVFVCAECMGRIQERGCMGYLHCSPVWADSVERIDGANPVCKACAD